MLLHSQACHLVTGLFETAARICTLHDRLLTRPVEQIATLSLRLLIPFHSVVRHYSGICLRLRAACIYSATQFQLTSPFRGDATLDSLLQVDTFGITLFRVLLCVSVCIKVCLYLATGSGSGCGMCSKYFGVPN